MQKLVDARLAEGDEMGKCDLDWSESSVKLAL